MRPRLYLVEDRTARAWSPMIETRPAGEIRFGALLLRERIERATGLASEGTLPDFQGDGAPLAEPTARGAGPLPGGSSLVLISARYLPPLPGESPATGPILPEAPPGRLTRLVVGGSHMGWLIPPAADSAQVALQALAPGTRAEAAAGSGGGEAAPELDLPGTALETLWDIVDRHAKRLSEDLRILGRGAGNAPPASPPLLPPGVAHLGREPLVLGEGVCIDPGAVLDTRAGPIHLGRGVTIRPHTHLVGPAWIGEGSALLGGVFDSVACGRTCRLRGEVSHSILHDCVNKAHDGYLGHSIVGSWVNLGAMTTNSDLKNNYGSVRAGGVADKVDTGLLKLGVFLGDHVKTGIGTRLSAGTCVGAGTNVFGPEPAGKWIPPFRWGGGSEFVPYRWGAFVATAERVMARRGVSLGEEERERLRGIWLREHGRDPADPADPA